jgi:flagellar biosynthesis protein FlhA
MVITKGAGRIAEVGARFMLDAMPGKQMAIDADLNAGLIGEADARERRQQVAQEADFYGSMDGASKFVRGDAVAGLIIMVVNIVGGLMIGMLQHSLDFSEALRTYTLLTVGDGLVAQIPALVISTAAGVMVSRVDTNEDVGQQMISQLFVNPRVLALTAGVLGLLGMVPGMPNFVFLLFTLMLGGLALFMSRREVAQPDSEAAPAEVIPARDATEASWDDVQLVDVLGLEVGHRLIPMVDEEQNGRLLLPIKSVRKKFAMNVGFLPPVVHIRDNLELASNAYTILLKEAVIGQGEVYPDRYLAINPGQVSGYVDGVEVVDPAFGLPAVWIDESQRDHAEIYGYTVVDASTVVATHLNHLMHRHAGEMLGRPEIQELLDRLGDAHKPLVEEVIDDKVSLPRLQRLLQNLLSEQVPIRDMRSILETLAELDDPGASVQDLTDRVRVGLGRAITQQWFGASDDLNVIGLDAQLEEVLQQGQSSGALEPGLAETLLQLSQEAVTRQEEAGYPPVLVVRHSLRQMLSAFLQARIHGMVVMADSEIPSDKRIRITSWIGAQA